MKTLLTLHETPASQVNCKQSSLLRAALRSAEPAEWRLRETLEVKRKRFLAQLRRTARRFASAPTSDRVNCNISRPLSGLPLILSLVVLAPKTVCFYTCRRLKPTSARADLPRLLLPPPKPLLLPRHVRPHYAETRQAASWQQLGFRSE